MDKFLYNMFKPLIKAKLISKINDKMFIDNLESKVMSKISIPNIPKADEQKALDDIVQGLKIIAIDYVNTL